MSPTTSTVAVIVGVTALVAAALTNRLSRPGAPFSVMDLPNERSLHVRPTPRTGGLAIVTATALGWLAVALVGDLGARFGWVAIATASVAAISFADDRGGVRARYRFGVHLLGAGLLLSAGLRVERLPMPGVDVLLGPVLGSIVTVLFVVWMTNLYNFMDGMDGFAGGMAASGFAFLGYGFWAHGSTSFAAVALVVAGAAVGFLRYNFPPARIFLGDVGSAPLGFVAAALMLLGERTNGAPLWASVLVFSPFIVDATVTLVRRLLRGEKVWLPHRTHYYQRLVQLGWGHRRTVLAEYALMLTCVLAAVRGMHASPSGQWGTIVTASAGYACAILLVSWMERRVAAASQRESNDA